MSPDLDLLPHDLRAASRMEREIALPFPAVLDVINLIEGQGILLLGWEAWRPITTRVSALIRAGASSAFRSSR